MFSFRPSLLALALFTAQAHAFEPFQIKDIRVEGIQRTEAGTVFSYLPVKVGETLTPDKASEAIKALYATGFFKDVRLETNGDVLIVTVEERPGIASVDFSGMKEFPKDDMKKGLKELGLADGRILDKSLLDKAEQELKRQYFNRGMYAVQIKATSRPWSAIGSRSISMSPKVKWPRSAPSTLSATRHSRKRICSSCST
jgi:outer membrane protein insertion porin family